MKKYQTSVFLFSMGSFWAIPRWYLVVSCPAEHLSFVSVETKTNQNIKLVWSYFGLFVENINFCLGSFTETKWNQNKPKRVKMYFNKAKNNWQQKKKNKSEQSGNKWKKKKKVGEQ